jgi:hypothetical protein
MRNGENEAARYAAKNKSKQRFFAGAALEKSAKG